MPEAHPVEFGQRAVEHVRSCDDPVAQVAKDLGVSESCSPRWMAVVDIDEGRPAGLPTDERAELVRL